MSKTDNYRLWTTAEMRLVRDRYKRYNDAELARMLGRSVKAVKAFRWRYRFIKSKEDHQFKAGHVPFNKGKHFVAGGSSYLTRFPKGHLPHNTKADGQITIRKNMQGRLYKFIRLDAGKWVHLHRYLWEQEHGPLSPGLIIVFRDGNSMNCSLDNLECITQREIMDRNRNYEKASVSMKRHWNYVRTKEIFGIKTSRHYCLGGH